MTKVLILEARFYQEYADALLAGAMRVLNDAKIKYEVVTVPGAYELPAALNMAAQTEQYDAFVALGCVIRGETTHYDLICNAIGKSFHDVILHYDLAFGLGVLTCENDAQAAKRADPDGKDYGGNAARAALTMLEIKKRFQGI